MKKVFVYAYDVGNLGDDLFVETLVKRYPDVQFYMWSNENQDSYKNLPRIKKINVDTGAIKFLEKIHLSLAARLKNYYIERCDAIIYIGGSIFIEYPNWRDIQSWWKYWSEKSKFYVLGANFGPYIDEEYRNSMESIFKNMEDVCFREKYSYDLFQSVDKIRYAPDILFGYPMPQTPKKKNKVFVSVINCRKKDEGSNKLWEYAEKYEKWLFDILKKYVDNNQEVILSSFCKVEGDEETANVLYTRLKEYKKNCKIRKSYYTGENSEEILREIASAEYVIATRFHAMILGISMGCYVLPVLYSNKTKNVLFDFGFKGEIVDIRKLESGKCVEMRYAKLSEAEINVLRIQSKKNFEKLDTFLA